MPHECTNCGRTFADGSKEMLSGCPDCGGNKFQFRPAGSSPDETKAPESANTTPDTSTTTDEPSNSGAVGRAANTVKGWVGSRERTDTADPDRDDSTQDPERTSQSPKQSTRSTQNRTPTGHESTERGETARKNERETRSNATKQPDSAQRPPAESDIESESDAESGSDVGSNEDRAQASARSEMVPEDELPERPDAEETGTVIEAPENNQPSLDELREELNSQFESIKVVEPGQYELNLMELYERDEYIIAMRENGRYVIQVPDSWTGAIDN